MVPFRTALAAALALAVAVPAGAEPAKQGWQPKKSKIPDEQIDQAIEKGCGYLKSIGGSAPGGGLGATGDELVLYTLFHGGVAKSDPVFQSLLKRIVDKDPAKTYSVACAAMCLSELDKVGYQWKLEQYAQFLVDNQCENGQWTYGEPIRIDKKPDLSAIATAGSQTPQQIGTGTSAPGAAPAVDNMVFKGSKKNPGDDKTPLYGTIYPKGVEPKAAPKAEAKGRGTGLQVAQQVPPKVKIKQRKRGPASGDNSNSQYAALGLRACAEAGVEVEEQVIRDALKWWEEAQCGNGSWGYAKEGDGWGSMTVGGIGAVAIYDWLLKKDWKGDKRILKATNDWLPTNWAVDKNPRAREVMPDRGRFSYYYLYGLERAGMIYGTDFFGSHDWYDEGALFLLKNQNPDGSWTGTEETSAWRTCFAILFLRRATRSLPPKIATGG